MSFTISGATLSGGIVLTPPGGSSPVPTISGYLSGGAIGGTGIEKFPFATDGNSTKIANLSNSRNVSYLAGQSSTTNGYASGGFNQSAGAYVNIIDKFSFSSNADAVDMADLTNDRGYCTGQSSSEDGYTSGGAFQSGNRNTIDKFPFSSDSNATDVGDLSGLHAQLVGQSGTTHGYVSGGKAKPSNANLSKIEKFPFSSNGNSAFVGNLTTARMDGAGQSSNVSGYTSGGQQDSPNYAWFNIIDKFPFSSDSNASDVGDLTLARSQCTGNSSSDNGYTSGGQDPGWARVNIIDKFPFASDGNATDVGDIVYNNDGSAGHQG